MLRKLFFREDDSTLGIRDRLIRRISSFGVIIAIVACFEAFFAEGTYLSIFPLAGLIIMLLISLLLEYKFNKHNAAAIFIGIAAVLLAFPSIFFLSGGVSGGATIYFVLGIFYWIGMFHGLQMILFTALTLCVDFFCYYIGYHYSEYIVKLHSNYEIFTDSFIGVVLVGVLLGIVTKYQIKSYDKERQIALEQRDEIEKFSDSKNDFFASMSHEIRTPINTIIGLNEMILREDSLSDEIVENALTIQSASKMLLSLVNDILDLSQIEGKKMEISPIEYGTENMFSDLIDMIRLRVENKELELHVNIDKDIPKVLYGDDKRIKQIILNLLTNAVKYTKQGSVTLEAHADKIGEEWCNLSISVRDTGVGIKSENLETLFDTFSRVDNTDNRSIEGTGLGLSISKQLIELMGGHITVDSIYTKGSVFTIMLEQKIIDESPIGNTDNIRKTRATRKSYQQLFEAPEARILIVDDNEMNRLVVEKLLKATKVSIDMAKSGAECLVMTQQKYYNLILMDYMMPEMNGATTLMHIRKQENGLCRETPVIVLTGDTLLQRKNVLAELGFDAFLEKPIRGELLEQKILDFLPEEVIEYRLQKSNISNNIISDFEVETKRKQKRVCITTDCTCDIPEDILEKYDIGLIYLYVSVHQTRFKDTKEIDSENMSLMNIADSELKADAAPIADYEEFFAERLTYAQDVIHISAGKNMGKSYNHAVKAAKGFGHVTVIDSGNLSCGMALIVLAAARMAMQGASVEEICKEVEHVKKNVVSAFLMPNIDKFYLNGYTNGFISRIYKVLRLHPVLRAKQSKLTISGTSIGNMDICRKRFIRRYLAKHKNVNNDILYITYAGISVDEQEMLLNEVNSSKNFNRVIVQKSSLTNACFSGRGSIGIAVYLEK